MTVEANYILIADDDPDDVETFREAFIQKFPGMSVIDVSNGEELIAYLESISTLPVIVLMDYKMPILTAAEILTKLNADDRYAGIIKLVWSTSDLRQYVDECRRAGAEHYFAKPNTGSELADILQNIGMVLEQRSIA
jgi:CheY-like chemotaxis protein